MSDADTETEPFQGISIWSWDDLDLVHQDAQWRWFTAWVQWLCEAYSPWVVLPPCWALHDGLAAELKVFCYWYQSAMTEASDAAEAIRWHNDLRRSAEAWRELATCAHEPEIRDRAVVADRRREKTAQFIDAAWRRQHPVSARDERPGDLRSG